MLQTWQTNNTETETIVLKPLTCLPTNARTDTAAFSFICCLTLTSVSLNVSRSPSCLFKSPHQWSFPLVSKLPRCSSIRLLLCCCSLAPSPPLCLFSSVFFPPHYPPLLFCLCIKLHLKSHSHHLPPPPSFSIFPVGRCEVRQQVWARYDGAHTHTPHSHLHYKARATDAAIQHGIMLTGPSATTTTHQCLATPPCHGNKPQHPH